MLFAMDYEQFLQSLADAAPPADTELALRALWYDANERPESAVRVAESSDSDHFCKRVRAYLYRKAGDENNAQLWYWRSGATRWTGSTQSEWEDIVQTIITDRVVANAYR
jgi:hypothetical protein